LLLKKIGNAPQAFGYVVKAGGVIELLPACGLLEAPLFAMAAFYYGGCCCSAAF